MCKGSPPLETVDHRQPHHVADEQRAQVMTAIPSTTGGERVGAMTESVETLPAWLTDDGLSDAPLFAGHS